MKELRSELEEQIGRLQKIPPRGDDGAGVDESSSALVLSLANEYENVRAGMPPGDARTRAMELVASRMRTLAPEAHGLIDYLTRSNSPGQRLAAITFLQVYPNLDYLDWLADRVGSEKPFVGYHAAIALLHAATRLRSGRPLVSSTGRPVRLGEESDALRNAIRKAKSYLGSELSQTDRAKILDEAEGLARGFR